MKQLLLVPVILLFLTINANAQCGTCEDWSVENTTGCDITLRWGSYSGGGCDVTEYAGVLPANTPATTWPAPCIQVADCGWSCPNALTVWDLPNPDVRIPDGMGNTIYNNAKMCSSCPSGYAKATYSYNPGNTPPHSIRFECQ